MNIEKLDESLSFTFCNILPPFSWNERERAISGILVQKVEICICDSVII